MFKWVVGAWHVVVFERTQHIHNGVHFTNVRQELVSQTFAFAGALYQTTNVDHLNRGVHDALGL